MLGPLFGLLLAPAALAAPCAETSLTFPSGFTAQVERDCSVAAGDALGLEPESYLFLPSGEIRTIRDAGGFRQHSRLVFPRNLTDPLLRQMGDSQVQIRTATGILATFSFATKKLISLSGVKLSVDLGTSTTAALPVEIADPSEAVIWTDASGRSCATLLFEVFFTSPSIVFRYPTDAGLREFLQKTCPSLVW